MKRKPPLTCVVFITFAITLSCTGIQNKNGGGTSLSGPIHGDYQKLIIGTWKIVAVHCDSGGNDCEWYAGRRVFSFSRNGDFSLNDIRQGTYRIEGTVCILDTGSRKFDVNIVQLDSQKLVTGENHRKTTEIYKKMK